MVVIFSNFRLTIKEYGNNMDKFDKVFNQCKNRTNVISDSRFLKHTVKHISDTYNERVVEIDFRANGSVEAILSSGEIIEVDNLILLDSYRKTGMM